jgi:hypothetical protein
MALSVISFASYLTRAPWNDDDHHALKFVKAVKGKNFGGWAVVPVLGRNKELRASNADDAIDWFAELAAAEIVKLRIPGPVILVPLPNSASTVKNGNVPRTALLAERIAAKLKNTKVWDGLRWTRKMTPTHQGGTRDPQRLYDNLVLTSNTPKGTLILIDDVLTKGGHLQAAVARLTDRKAECKLAVCAGRTVLESQEQPFLVLRQEIEEFKPTKS